jgi:hypothetical protein
MPMIHSARRNAGIRSGSQVYDLSLSISSQDGRSETLKAYEPPVTLRLKVDVSINPKLAAIYYFADDGSLEYMAE